MRHDRQARLERVGHLLTVDGMEQGAAELDVADDRRIRREQLREGDDGAAIAGHPLAIGPRQLIDLVKREVALADRHVDGAREQIRGQGRRIGDKPHLDLVDLGPAEHVAVERLCRDVGPQLPVRQPVRP